MTTEHLGTDNDKAAKSSTPAKSVAPPAKEVPEEVVYMEPVDDGASDAEKKSPSRPWVKPLLWGLLILGVIYGGYRYYEYRTTGQYMQSTNDAYVSADDVTVSSKLPGYVKNVTVAENAPVQQGALLLEIDSTDYQNRINQADAQIDLARANTAATLSGINEAQASVAQAQAGVAAAQRDVSYFNTEIARYRPLVASGAEPKTALDQLIANRDKSAADVRAKQAAVTAAQSRITSIRSQGGASAAQIRTAQVQRQAATDDMNATQLTAPIGGRVANSTVRVGQFIQPGMRLMTIVPVGDLFIEANFKETQMGMMRPGQPVTVKVDALPDVEFHGTIESITPGTGANFSLIPPQNATGNFTKIVQRVPVKIRIKAGPETRKILIPGLSLEVTVDTRSGKSSVEAIRKEQGDK